MRLKAFFVCLLIFIVPSYFFAFPLGPGARTVQLSAQVLKILREKDSLKKQNGAQKLLADYFDFQTFANWTLWDHWEELSSIQREKFVDLFYERFKEKIWEKLMQGSKKEFQLQVTGENKTKDFTEVYCQLSSNRKRVKLSLIWVFKDKRWRLADLTLAKANLVANYQGQFNKIIREYGFEELIRRLEKYMIQ